MRIASYADVHRYCLGVNYDALPVNKPRCPVHNYHRDGALRFDGPVAEARVEEPTLKISGDAGRFDPLDEQGVDDFAPAGDLFRLMSNEQQGRLMDNLANAMGPVPEDIQRRQIENIFPEQIRPVELELRPVSASHRGGGYRPIRQRRLSGTCVNTGFRAARCRAVCRDPPDYSTCRYPRDCDAFFSMYEVSWRQSLVFKDMIVCTSRQEGRLANVEKYNFQTAVRCRGNISGTTYCRGWKLWRSWRL